MAVNSPASLVFVTLPPSRRVSCGVFIWVSSIPATRYILVEFLPIIEFPGMLTHTKSRLRACIGLEVLNLLHHLVKDFFVIPRGIASSSEAEI